MLLRIEDTDRERSTEAAIGAILDGLKWLGLDWDGETVYQFARAERHREVAHQMLASGHAYRCYCTEEELAAEREALLAAVELPRYLGRCRDLGAADRARLEAAGRRPVLRFKVPEERTVTVLDQVRGQVSFDCSGIGDFIIVKSDGVPTYNFAVVVDDYLMDITHVLRAEEHLSNTPRQILICEALGWELPVYAHISLILGKDRSKMSKRHGATAIDQYRARGYLSEAMVNFLALMGWSPGGEEEVFTPAQLQKQFSLERVSKSPAVFDPDKLDHLNGYYIRQSTPEQLIPLALPFLQRAGYIQPELTPAVEARVKLIITAVREYLTNMSELPGHVAVFFHEPDYTHQDVAAVLEQAQVPVVLGTVREQLLAVEDFDEQAAKALLKALPKSLGLGGKKIYQPLRVALTGKTQGPELYHLLPALGVEQAVARLDRVLKSINRSN
jgi:nondiscriminating glutamyl-tRNA synthetase